MKIRRGALAALFAGGLFMSQLSGCGGGGGSSGSTSSSTTLAGTAMAGPFLSGQACAYRVASGAKGALLGSCANLANSAFSIDIGSYTGDVLIEIAAGATYDDEANPNDNATGTTLTGALRTLIAVASVGGTTSVTVTPLTETAVRLAGSTLDAASVQAAISQLQAVLPTVSGLDLLDTVPVTTTDLGLAYREMLRALSNLQWVAGGNGAYAGGLDAYLAFLIGQIGTTGNTVGTDLLAQLNNGLNSGCTVTNGALSCTVSTGGSSSGGSSSSSSSSSGGSSSGSSSGGITCDTSLFQAGAPIAAPTSQQLATFARTYTGSEGDYDMNFNFVATGSATMVFNADGSATYNSAAYVPTSYCLETLNGGGQQLVIHGPNNSHFDLRGADGWSGYSPAGHAVSATPYNGGGSGGGSGSSLTIPGGRSISNAASVTYQPFPNQPGKIITFSEGGVSVELYDYQGTHTLGIAAGAAGFSIGVTPNNACALDAAVADAFTPSCASVGVTFDRTTGQATFTNTPMHPIIFTCPGTCEINGSLSFTPY